MKVFFASSQITHRTSSSEPKSLEATSSTFLLDLLDLEDLAELDELGRGGGALGLSEDFTRAGEDFTRAGLAFLGLSGDREPALAEERIEDRVAEERRAFWLRLEAAGALYRSLGLGDFGGLGFRSLCADLRRSLSLMVFRLFSMANRMWASFGGSSVSKGSDCRLDLRLEEGALGPTPRARDMPRSAREELRLSDIVRDAAIARARAELGSTTEPLGPIEACGACGCWTTCVRYVPGVGSTPTGGVTLLP